MRSILKFIPSAATLFLCIGILFGAEGSDSPNILIVICDDLNDSIAGIGGHPQALTPNIDRLAARGVTFSNTASNVPICGPSRASLWSGLLPTTTGFYGYKQQENRWHNNPIIKRSKTLFELMTQSGYRSFATGKIHHNGHSVMKVFENPDGYPGYGSARTLVRYQTTTIRIIRSMGLHRHGFRKRLGRYPVGGMASDRFRILKSMESHIVEFISWWGDLGVSQWA